MTSTNISTGLGESSKPSSKVLRPPGGGSSDIFGSDTPATPRSVRNHMASNIFGSTQDASVKNNGDSVRRAQKNIDSYSRLFGEPERPLTPAKNHMKSNIPIGGVAGKSSTSPDSSTSSLSSSSTNGLSAATNGHKNGKMEIGNGNGSSHGGNNIEHLNGGVSKTVSQRRNKETVVAEILLNSDGLHYQNQQESEHDQQWPKQEKYSSNSNNASTKINADHQKIGSELNNYKNKNNMNDYSAKINNNNNVTNKNANVTNSNHINNMNGKMNHNGIDEKDRNFAWSAIVSPVQLSYNDNSNNKHSIKYSPMRSPRFNSRNPVTGMGVEMPNDRPRRLGNRRDGNPVTGEGYKPAGAEINTTIPCLNGANQVINKNRIPPGGFSSGLW